MAGEFEHGQLAGFVDGRGLVGEEHGDESWVECENGEDGLDEAHEALETD